LIWRPSGELGGIGLGNLALSACLWTVSGLSTAALSPRGTEGSNPSPSSAESVANLTFEAHPIDGGPYSASLAKVGADVTFVARGAHLAAMRENGLHIKGDRGENQPSLYDRLSKLTAGKRRVDGAVKLL